MPNSRMGKLLGEADRRLPSRLLDSAICSDECRCRVFGVTPHLIDVTQTMHDVYSVKNGDDEYKAADGIEFIQ